MTSFETAEMSCPQCGHVQTAGFFRSVNVTVSPDLRELLFNRGINIVTCDQCGTRGFLPVPFIYHDMALRFLVLLDCNNTLSDETDHIFEIFEGRGIVPEAYRGLIPDSAPQYCLRIVRTYDRLLEKILIFETGLDDRIIEILSYLIAIRKEEKGEGEELSVYFEDLAVSKDGREMLLFRIFAKEDPVDAVWVPHDTIYAEVRDTFLPLCEDFERDSPIHEIDHEYAGRLLIGRGE
jgi:hypothetical protein